MSARKPRKSKPAEKRSLLASFRRVMMVMILIIMIPIAFISFTERANLPEQYRNHDAVIMVYKERDNMIAAVWGQLKDDKPLSGDLFTHTKEPINVRPAAKKPEQGYSRKDRDQMQDLIREEGETP